MKASNETLIYLDTSGEGKQFTARAASGIMSVYKVTWPVGATAAKTEGFQMGVAVTWWSDIDTLPEKVRKALKAEAEKVRKALKAEAEKADRLTVLEKVLQATEEYRMIPRTPGASDMTVLIRQSYNQALADIAKVLETGELKQ